MIINHLVSQLVFVTLLTSAAELLQLKLLQLHFSPLFISTKCLTLSPVVMKRKEVRNLFSFCVEDMKPQI